MMKRFFGNLERGLTALDALQEAQRDVQRHGRGMSRLDPYYWAGWVLSGDPRLTLGSVPRLRVGREEGGTTAAPPTPRDLWVALASLLVLLLFLAWCSHRKQRGAP
jgi:hypothetical protein